MKRILKILILAVVLSLLLAGGLWHLNQVVLPVKARIWAQEAASKALGRPVTIQRIRLHLWHGFMAEGITIQESPSFGEGPFLRVEKVSGALLPLPLLKHREIIIPALHLDGAELHLLQSTQGRWNVEDLLAPHPASQKAPSSFRLILPKIVLSNSSVAAQVKRGRPLLVTLRDIQAEVHLGLPAKVEGTLTTRLQADTPQEQGMPVHISLELAYTLADRQLKATGKTTGPLEALLPLAPPSTRSRILELHGTAALNWTLKGNPKGPFSLNVRWNTTDFRIAVPHPISTGWPEEAPAQLRWEGGLNGQIQAEIPTLPLPQGWNDFQGSLRLEKGKMGPVPYAEELREITGEILFIPDAIRTESLTAVLPSGPTLQMTGSVTWDEARSFGFRVTSEFPLEQLPTLPAAMESFWKSVNPSGRAQIEALVKGALKPAVSLQPVLTAHFQDVQLTLPNQQRVQKAAGSLRWQPDLLTATEVRGEFLEKPFSLEGSVVNFAQPEVDARLSWSELSAEAQMAISSDRVQLHTVKGRIGSGQFRLFGEIAWPHHLLQPPKAASPPANGLEGRDQVAGWPQANLFAEGTVLAQELPRLWPKWFSEVEKHGAQGEVSFRGLMEGNLKQPEARTADLKLTSPSFQIQGFQLKQMAVHLKQQGNQFELASARAQYAEGSLRLSGKLNLGSEKKSWNARLGMEGVRLEQLASDLKWNARNLAGWLSGEWEGQGEGGNLAALSGAGDLRIAGAQILEFPLLGDFAGFLGLPSLRKIVFQEAQGTFLLGQGKIRTKDLQLRSPQATLTILGEGGFLQGTDSPIHWRILPTLSPELIPEESRSKIGKIIAQGASYLIGEVRIMGTWKNPKRKFLSKPVTQILNEQLFNLQDILREFF